MRVEEDRSRMLSRLDDYPIHQTPEPLLHPATTDRNFYDRYWFNGFSRDGEFYFGVALGVYPNRRVMDASFSIAADGVQHSFHASRLIPYERTETRVGPLAIEVVEPMKVLRVRLASNRTGIECDLTFRARTAAVEEPRAQMRRDNRVIMDTTRFTQFGKWEGKVSAAGRTLAVDPRAAYGLRDRSWGVRPVGEPESGKPDFNMPQLFWVWAPVHFEKFCTHFGMFEDADGYQLSPMAMRIPAFASSDDIPPLDDDRTEHLSSPRHRLEFHRGTRRIARAHIEMTARSGDRIAIDLEPLLRFQMLGLGYLHPEWGHACWKGEEAIGAESWKLDEVDPLDFRFQHIQWLCRARLGNEAGFGTLEQLMFGPHKPSGFEGMLDGAV